MLACGSNGQGQLGVGHDDDVASWTPVVGLETTEVAVVVGGGNHTLVLDENGHLYGAGSNANGQLGLKVPKSNRFVPIRDNIDLIGAGWDFSVVATANEIWQTDKTGWVHIPLPPDKVPSQISCGMSHCAVLMADGSVYAWGASRHGQAGPPCKVHHSPVLLAQNAKQVACGRDFTAVLFSSSELKVFGKFPYEYPPKASSVLAGWTTLAAVGGGGYNIVGNNRHHQLEIPSNIDSMVLGSEHGVALAGDTVVTWGWGEHGNCPPPFTTRTKKLGAGCATSFIIQN